MVSAQVCRVPAAGKHVLAKKTVDKAGGLNLKYEYAADFEIWTRFAQHAELYSVSVPLVGFRIRPGEQKSSVHKDKYEEEVKKICQYFRSPPKIWSFISKRSEFGRILSRLMVWKKGNFIAYSFQKQDWVLKRSFRPLSRYSLSEILLEMSASS